MFHFSSEIIFGQLLLTFGNFLLVTLSESNRDIDVRYTTEIGYGCV